MRVSGYRKKEGTFIGRSEHLTYEIENGDMIFDLTYSWNDIMDPNPIYQSDMKKAGIAQSIPFASPMDFEMHITWSDKTIIRSKEG